MNHVGSDVGIGLQPSHQCFFFWKREGQESPWTRLIRFLSTVMRVQLAPDNSNQTRFPLDFLHTFTVTRTLDNSNLPLTRNYFCLAQYWLIMLCCLLSPCSKYQHISWCPWSDRAWYLYCSPIRIPFLFFLLFASNLELFSISLEGSIELSGVDCTYSSKSRKDNRTKR